jgi:hypothetical protein
MSPVLQPRRKTAARYDVCVRSVRRWEQDPERTGFPPSVIINGRRYDDVAALDAWDDHLRRKALKVTENSPPEKQKPSVKQGSSPARRSEQAAGRRANQKGAA